MGVYKYKDQWYLDYYEPNGIRIREKVYIEGVLPREITKRDALDALAIRKAEIAQDTFDIAKTQKPLPFETLAEMYLVWARINHVSIERDETSVKALLSHFKGKNARTVSLWEAEKYKAVRKKEGKKPATINKELGVLRRMFNLAVKGQFNTRMHKNPIEGMTLLTIPNMRKRVLSKGEFQALYEASDPHLRPIILCAYLTGMRRSEIADLKWENIDFEKGYIHLEKTKTNEPRSIPIHSMLLKEIKELKAKSESDHVFTRPDGKPYTSRTSWRTLWNQALKKSRIPKATFHDLRRTFITNLVIEEKEDLVTVMSLSGHKDFRTLKHYAHTHEEAKRNAIEKLGFMKNVVPISEKKAES